jgi:hypothetical protein
MPHQPYQELTGLEHVFLEDSYVVALLEESTRIVFILDVVLTEQHPLYKAPSADAQYCYRRALLTFPHLHSAVWSEKRVQPFVDAAGAIDYGNIDSFYAAQGWYHLEGDWGIVDIHSQPPLLQIQDDEIP